MSLARASIALLAGIMLAGSAHAHSHKLKSLEIVHPWCWENDAAGKTVAVYMTVRNSSRRPDQPSGLSNQRIQPDRSFRIRRPLALRA